MEPYLSMISSWRVLNRHIAVGCIGQPDRAIACSSLHGVHGRLPRRFRRQTIDVCWVLSCQGASAQGYTGSVVVHDEFSSGLTVVAISAAAQMGAIGVDQYSDIRPSRFPPAIQCLQTGVGTLGNIAVVRMRGRERSVLQGLDKLGPWSLSRFPGQFDEGSTPIWRDGQLLIESVRRFKGQASPAVVLTECDIAQLDQLSRRLLFVGLTHARVHLEWVISSETACLLEQKSFGLKNTFRSVSFMPQGHTYPACHLAGWSAGHQTVTTGV